MLVGCQGLGNQLQDGYQVGDATRAAVQDLSALCDPAHPEARRTARAAYFLATGQPFPIPVCDVYNGVAQ